MTDTTIATPGIKGMTRSTWRDETHLRGMLLKLISQHSDASRDELEDMYLTKARKKPALVDEALRRAFDNDLARVQQPARSPQRRTSAAAVTALADKIKTVVLLDLMLPTGRKLRDSTGRDCLKAGGWLIQVAQIVGDSGIVGEQLGEAQLAEIFADSTRKAK
jgi:hypothetical protein